MYATRLVLIAVLAAAAVSCSSDGASPAGPAPNSSHVIDPEAITVNSVSELEAALIPANAGRTIHVRAGIYDLITPLNVPDGATLEGEGVMQFNGGDLPVGFEAATRTTLRMTGNIAGNVLSLGDGVTVRRLAIEDMPGRIGNTVGIFSRNGGDSLHATLDENEIVNPNPHTVVPAGPAGCGVAIVTQNPNGAGAPPPHANASLSLNLTESLIRSSVTGTGCGLFAYNFAPLSSVSVTLTGNVVGGGMIASGGVSRPDEVHDSQTGIQSRRNLYLNESPNKCSPARFGWNVQGGSGMPTPVVIGATVRNSLRIHSQDDRIEGFTTAIFAVGGRRFFGSPTAGPSSDNRADLQLLGTAIATPSCVAATADFRLAGSFVANGSIVSGDGNTLRAVVRSVTGSGTRSNLYGHVLTSTGVVPSASEGADNRLVFAGSLRAFLQTNSEIVPAPADEFFTGGSR